MTVKEFMAMAEQNEELRKALSEKKPENVEALVEFAREHGFQVNSNQISDDELANVVGGRGRYAVYTGCIHKGCGGIIDGAGNLFAYCTCRDCGETHYWLWDFDYYMEERQD